MKSARITAIVLALFLIATSIAFGEYDRDLVRTVMRDNVAHMGDLTKAARNDDFMAAGQALMKLAEGAFAVREFTPAKGTSEQWTETWDAFIAAAFKGIGACGEQDSRGLDDAIKELKKLNGEGHKDHR